MPGDVPPPGGLDATVQRCRKTDTAIRPDEREPPILPAVPLQDLKRAIRRAIIDRDDLKRFKGLFAE